MPATFDLWRDGSRSPYLNMAIDDLLLAGAPRRERPLVRLYTWDRPSVSIGYFQASAGIPADHAVVRRPTGGGLVCHDHDVTFTIVVGLDHTLAAVDRHESYRQVNAALAAALHDAGIETWLATTTEAPAERARLVCFTTPARHDVIGPHGKIAGGAQRRTRAGILHQGSLERPAVPDLADPVPAVVAACAALFAGDPLPWQPPAPLLADADALAAAKYATDAWNRRH